MTNNYRALLRSFCNFILLIALSGATACGGAANQQSAASSTPRNRTLTIGAYTTPREVYGEQILPAFARSWKQKTGEIVTFQESYLGSGAQARAIVSGFEADVAALSLEPDIQQIVDAKLITHDWKARGTGGMISRSIVVIGVRAGNPKKLMDWVDLGRPGIGVLTPNPKTSGGAMWNVVAIYGAALRGHAGPAAGDAGAAESLLRRVVANVSIMDKGARESMITFETGTGDAAITYENEVRVARKAGKAMDYVIPHSTVLIENPVAVVDAYADKHGNRDLAEAFVDFLATPDSQRSFAAYGLRPIDDTIAKSVAAQYPAVPDLFTIADLGGWPTVIKTLFDDGAVWERVSERQTTSR
jgi:sulfate/thiosulfate-binding protein